jgi:hypothetical protein
MTLGGGVFMFCAPLELALGVESSCLGAAVGVTQFITIIVLYWVTLSCSAYVRPGNTN